MHYTGMAAMIMDADILYEPIRFGAAVAIAITASAAAIGIIFYLRDYSGHHKSKWQLLAALIMGAAICGMHYTGMFAKVFLPYADCRFDSDQTYYILASAVAMISGTIFIAAISLNIFLKEKRETDSNAQSWNVVPFMIAIFGILVTGFSTFAIHKYYLEMSETKSSGKLIF